nr:uncharacterized protein LOC113802072 [Penaeus vannamei]
MGKLESILGGEPRYRCFTFAEEEGEGEVEEERHRYVVSRTSSEACAALGESSDSSYRIFGEAVAPGEPTIHGYDASERVKIGSVFNLTCSSGGGFPHAKLTWFKNGEVVPSETFQEAGESAAVVEVTVEGPENETEYLCRAHNFVAGFSASVVVRAEQASQPAFEDIMLPSVSVVEDETAFLPCIRTQEEDTKMDWFDADIETQLTSGTTILADEKTHFQPWNRDGVLGLVVLAGFVDTKYACNVNGRRVGSTRALILARYLIGEGGYEPYDDHLDYTDYHKTVQEGRSVFLNCTIGSNSSSTTVRWRRNPGSVLLTQNDISLAEDEGYTVDVLGNSYILYVAEADVRHAGSYFCQIVDEVEVYTKNYTISIDDMTQTYMGQNGSINCYAQPGEEIKFVHEGAEIHPSNETRKYDVTKIEERGQTLTGRSGTLYTLTVFNASLEDEGIYMCVAEKGYADVVLREAVLLVDLEELTPYTNESVATELTTTTTASATTTPFSLFDWWGTTTTASYPEEITPTTTTKIPKFKIRTTTEPGVFWETTTPYYENETETTTSEASPTDTYTTPPPFSTSPSTTTTTYQDTTTATTPTTTTTPTMTTPVSAVERTEEPEEYSTVDSEVYYTVGPEEDYSGQEVDYEVYYDVNEGEKEKEEEEKEEEEEQPTAPPPPQFAEVILPCEGSEGLKIEDITWRIDGELLFLGTLDLIGMPGLSLSADGALVLLQGPIRDVRDGRSYVCLGFDTNIFDDVTLVSYHVSLSGEDTIVEKISEGRTDKKVITKPTPKPVPEPDAPDLEFGGLEDGELVVLANTERVGRRIEEVLKSGGLDVRFLNQMLCTSPTNTRSWLDAQTVLEECEASARASGLIDSDKSVFIGIDFYVEIAPSSWFAVTKLFIRNARKDVSVSVFAPMVPVPVGKVSSSGPDRPDDILVSESWWDSVQGAGASYGNALAASVLSLQESYQSLLQENEDES